MSIVSRAASLRPVEQFTRRSIVGLAGVVAALSGLGVLLVLMRLNAAPVRRLDGDVAVWLGGAVTGRPAALSVLTFGVKLGGSAVLWWLVTVGTAAMLIRRQVHLAMYLLVTGAGALVLVPAASFLVRWVVPTPAAATTFPSGPALNATVFCGALLLVFLPAVPRRLHPLAIALVAGLVIGVGVADAALGGHYVSDVLAGWLLGLAWLGVTAHALRRWRADSGQPPRPITDGLAPEAAPDLMPAPLAPVRDGWHSVAWLVTAWVLIALALYGMGTLATRHPPVWDESVPAWLAARRIPRLDALSQFWSQAGNTHWILAVGLVIAPLAVAYTRRWRPAVFLAVTMFGELALFVGTAAVVGRPRPLVTQLDGHLPTSSFPSGHTAATACLYGALAVLVMPRTHRWWRWIAVTAAVLMPALVALSRVYRGEHHPLDVAGGVVLAVLWLAVMTLVLRPNADFVDSGRSLPALAELVSGDVPVSYARGTRSAVVVNPARVGDLPGRRAHIIAALADAGWPAPIWLETTAEDPGGGQTRQAIDAGIDVVFAAGGDGTVTACANALAGTGVALAVLPFGTGNLLARNLGLPAHIPDAVAVATGGHRRHLDVGTVDNRCFAVMAGMGFDAEMLHDAPAGLKARVGWLAYAVAAVRHLCAPPMRVTISIDHAPPLTRQARTVLIGNVGRLQGGVRLLPGARPDDGLLDVAVLMPPRRRNWFPLAWALLRRRPTVPMMETFQATHVEIVSSRTEPRETDGDLIEPSRVLTATIRPAALWVCAPG
jgi:undecaprenyl-diphosphatase